eukprot:jgi/Chlat1/4305/Chrsp29S04603
MMMAAATTSSSAAAALDASVRPSGPWPTSRKRRHRSTAALGPAEGGAAAGGGGGGGGVGGDLRLFRQALSAELAGLNGLQALPLPQELAYRAKGPHRWLVSLDFIPLFRHLSYRERYMAPLMSIKRSYADACMTFEEEFFASQRYMSEGAMVMTALWPHASFVVSDTLSKAYPALRAHKDDKSAHQHRLHARALPAFQQTIRLYFDLLASAQPVTEYEGQRVSAEQQLYVRSLCARPEPSEGLLASVFGEDWAHALADALLQNGVGVPS